QKGEAVKAEVLAGMYDQSLDIFNPNNWSFNIYSQINSQLNWQSNSTFQRNYSKLFGRNPNPSIIPPKKTFPQLNWFGFYMNQFNIYYNHPLMVADYAESNNNEKNLNESIRTKSTNTQTNIKEINQAVHIHTYQIRSNFKE